jgi:hypothetical protein
MYKSETGGNCQLDFFSIGIADLVKKGPGAVSRTDAHCTSRMPFSMGSRLIAQRYYDGFAELYDPLGPTDPQTQPIIATTRNNGLQERVAAPALRWISCCGPIQGTHPGGSGQIERYPSTWNGAKTMKQSRYRARGPAPEEIYPHAKTFPRIQHVDLHTISTCPGIMSAYT